MKLRKKAVLDNLGDLLTGLGVIAILFAVIFLIIGETKTQVIEQDACNSSGTWNGTTLQCCANSTSCASGALDHYSKTYEAQVGVQGTASDIPGWLTIVVITIIGGVLLTLVRYFKK